MASFLPKLALNAAALCYLINQELILKHNQTTVKNKRLIVQTSNLTEQISAA